MGQLFRLRSSIFTFANCVALYLVCINAASAENWRPPVLRTVSDSTQSKLKLDPALKLELSEGELERKSSVRIKGQSSLRDISLIWTTRFIKLTPEGEFELVVPLLGKVTPFTLVAVNDYGEVERNSFEILFEDWDIYQASVRENLTKSAAAGKVSVGIGPTLISYKETGVADYSSIVLTGKANYSRSVFSANWSIGVSGFFTLLPLTENYSASARFLGLNFRLGYHFLKIPPPWAISLQVGSYYTTMFVSGNQFGFENVNGPQLYPVVQRTLEDGKSVRGYFKLSPLTANTSGFSFGSRELALGLDYVFLNKRNKPLSVQVDFSDLLLKLTDQTITTKTFSTSISYRF